MTKRFLKYLSLITTIYIIFLILSIIIIPKYKISKMKVDSVTSSQLNSFQSEFTSTDMATVISDLDLGLSARVDLIKKAEDSIDIAYYRIDNDISGRIILGELLKASERGVNVRILINNSLKYQNRSNRFIYEAMNSNENLEMKFYGGFRFTKPWYANNVLHDKIIVIDDKYFMTAGRNISDRFLILEGDLDNTYDFDFIAKSTEENSESVILQSKDYFESLWDSDYAIAKVNRSELKADDINAVTEKLLSEYDIAYSRLVDRIIDNCIDNMEFYPIKKATLITNPIDSVVKEPMIWNNLTGLINNSNGKVVLQSPYVSITGDMESFLDLEHIKNIDFNVLTNSIASSPNIPAFSNYLTKKESLLEYAKVYEYQAPGSIHGKAALIGDDFSAIGSFNSDSRSTYFSAENMVIVNGAEFNGHLEELMQNLMDKSLVPSGKYEYFDSINLEPVEVSTVKMVLFRIAGFLGKPFDFLV